MEGFAYEDEDDDGEGRSLKTRGGAASEEGLLRGTRAWLSCRRKMPMSR